MPSGEIASFYASISADTKGFTKGLGEVKAGMGGLEKTSASIGKILAGTFAVAATGAALFVTAIGKSVSAAMEFEQGVADIGAMMSLTDAETQKLGDHIMDLGLDPNLKVSASQATEAIMALGTAGLTTSQIMGGASEATVLLANATGADFGNAASIATDVMAQFNIEASGMQDAVSAISGVTVASKFGIQDYQYAIAQAGGVASAVGVDFDDFNAVIAATSSSFDRGSDAGTSLKTFLQRLVPTTNDAKQALLDLGLSTGEDVVTAFYDASGAMRPMEEIAENLQNAFSGLSDAQKNEAASTIFGTDAMRTALSLAKGGGEIITEMKAAIGKVDAEELAAKRMDTFAGSMEIMQGVMETMSISIGQKFLPVLRPMIDKFSELATAHGPKVIDFFGNFANSMATGIQLGIDWATRVIPPLWQGFKNITDSIGKMLKPVTNMIGDWLSWKDVLLAVAIVTMPLVWSALAATVAFLAPVILAVAKVTAVVVALRAAWENNFLGIRDISIEFFERFTGFVKTYSGIWKGDWGKTLSFFANNTGEAFEIMWRQVKHYWGIGVKEVMHIWNTWTTNLGIDIDVFVRANKSRFHVWWGNVVKMFEDGVDTAVEWMEYLFGWFKPREWWNKGLEIIQSLWDAAKQIWHDFAQWWKDRWSSLTGTIDVEMKMGSPSKEMMDRGKWAVEGFQIGAENAMPGAIGAMSGLAYGAMGASESQPDTTLVQRTNQLLEILINELRNKNMTANVTVAGGGASLADSVRLSTGLRSAF